MNLPRQGCAIFFGLMLTIIGASGQPVAEGPPVIRSVSGQFVITVSQEFSPLLHRPDLAADTNLVRLQPALLAVGAERFKVALWHELGMPADAAWRGKIFLTLRPARSVDDEVFITSAPFTETWNYRLELPDVLPCQRYARSLATVLLLEIANRHNLPGVGHSVEVPPWLAAGLAQQAVAEEGANVVLSAPASTVDGLAQSRMTNILARLDALAGARHILLSSPPLTFEQLNWPEDDQMNGNDGGVYLASSQLFVHELLGLKDGAAKCRDLLARLPDCRNWQNAFLTAFAEDFSRPLDVEKWWAVRVIAFGMQNPGPGWATAPSRRRMSELLSVPVDFRSDSNALPVHADISLQTMLQNFEPTPRDAVVQTKLRDLQLAEFRLAPPFNALADGYRSALADFLGEGKTVSRAAPGGKAAVGLRRGAGILETIKKLDALDVRRRELEAQLDSLPGSLNSAPP